MENLFRNMKGLEDELGQKLCRSKELINCSTCWCWLNHCCFSHLYSCFCLIFVYVILSQKLYITLFIWYSTVYYLTILLWGAIRLIRIRISDSPTKSPTFSKVFFFKYFHFIHCKQFLEVIMSWLDIGYGKDTPTHCLPITYRLAPQNYEM